MAENETQVAKASMNGKSGKKFTMTQKKARETPKNLREGIAKKNGPKKESSRNRNIEIE